jgi:hypothetical protein
MALANGNPSIEFRPCRFHFRSRAIVTPLKTEFDKGLPSIEIRQGNDRIELIATDRVADHLPTSGDVELTVMVQSQGFVGDGCHWVEAPHLRRFVEQLRELDSRRNGSAEIESISPGEFQLRILAKDLAGHVAAAGRVSRSNQALEFSFEFSASHLPRIVAAFSAMADG